MRTKWSGSQVAPRRKNRPQRSIRSADFRRARLREGTASKGTDALHSKLRRLLHGGQATGASIGSEAMPKDGPALDGVVNTTTENGDTEDGDTRTGAVESGGTETGGTDQPQPPSQGKKRSSGIPPWLAPRLARRRSLHRDAATRTGDQTSGDLRRSIGEPQDLLPCHNSKGVFPVREKRFSLDYRHGSWGLGEVCTVACDDLATLAKDPALAELNLKQGIYLDIETTGLSGGAGTIAFLVALGWFETVATTGGLEFVLWQGFLRGPEQEAALLQGVADRVAASAGVVSFFGKSFDRHRLEDKMRIHGVSPPFEGSPHLDLYHPLRRLYRAALENGKLQTMERYLCDVRREDDLPGSFAPAAWFDFLAGRAHRLEDVFRHNADDVLSLVVLAAHLGCTLGERRSDGQRLSGCELERAKGITKVLDAQRRRAEARPWLERYVERGGDDKDIAFNKIAARVRRMST